MNQIEKVARAIRISDGLDPDEVFEGQPIWHDRIDNAKAAIAAMTVQAEPVAVVGNNWSLRWAPQETLTEIAKRTGIKVGSPLYAHPPVPQSSDAEITRLTEALKTQAAAVRTLQANEQTEINMLRAKAREAHIAIATLDSEREANAILTEALRAAEEREKALREALAWYGEQARLARLIHSEGEAGRHALQDDGGKLARAALGGPQ